MTEDARQGLFVGTYARLGGPGLVRIDERGPSSPRHGEAVPQIANASYHAHSRRFDVHYFVDEEAGNILAYRYDRGHWLLLRSVTSGGQEPCFVALDPEERQLAVANYGDGSLALVALDPVHGLPEGPPRIHRQQGSGPDPDRQEGPHVHCARFSRDGRWLLISDLGSDQVIAFDMHESGLDHALPVFAAPPGSGPRHVLFSASGERLLLLSELASSLTLFDVKADGLVPTQTVSTLPGPVACDTLGGHLALNAAGTRVYVSNRGHDSISAFRIDEDGLALLQNVPSGGQSPRHFLLLETTGELVVAHEESGTVSRLHLRENGLLDEPDDKIEIAGAVFLLAV